MKSIILAFTLKDQPFDLIVAEIERIAQIENSDPAWPTLLIHGFMPRSVIVARRFSTHVIDTLEQYFPVQLNLYFNGPLRSQMAFIAVKLKTKVYVIGKVIDDVKEEVERYKNAGLEIEFVELKETKNSDKE